MPADTLLDCEMGDRMLKEKILSAPRKKTHVFFINQAGFVIKSPSGVLIAVDLYLSDAIERYDGFKRLCAKLLTPNDVIFDAVVCTHAHYDHFDPDSIPLMLANNKTRLFASKKCKQECEELGISGERLCFMQAGDTAQVGDVMLEFVFCDHGDSAPDAVGVVLTVAGKTIYEAGDTCLRLDKADDICQGRQFDVAILPINGAFGNMNEAEAVAFCAKLNPKLVIPCHYWTFAEQHGDPGIFVDILKKDLPGQEYLLMRQGESFET
jgi:L-ascorbate 6-phosphate lactonase